MTPQGSNSDLPNQARAWAIALNVVYGTIGFGAMGFAIDYFAHTKPRWTLILGGIGLFVGTYRFVREALALNREASRPRRREDEGENRS